MVTCCLLRRLANWNVKTNTHGFVGGRSDLLWRDHSGNAGNQVHEVTVASIPSVSGIHTSWTLRSERRLKNVPLVRSCGT